MDWAGESDRERGREEDGEPDMADKGKLGRAERRLMEAEVSTNVGQGVICLVAGGIVGCTEREVSTGPRTQFRTYGRHGACPLPILKNGGMIDPRMWMMCGRWTASDPCSRDGVASACPLSHSPTSYPCLWLVLPHILPSALPNTTKRLSTSAAINRYPACRIRPDLAPMMLPR